MTTGKMKNFTVELRLRCIEKDVDVDWFYQVIFWCEVGEEDFSRFLRELSGNFMSDWSENFEVRRKRVKFQFMDSKHPCFLLGGFIFNSHRVKGIFKKIDNLNEILWKNEDRKFHSHKKIKINKSEKAGNLLKTHDLLTSIYSLK